MKWQELLDRISSLEIHSRVGELVVPPRELVAFNVRCLRSMRQLKKSALADLAGVSVSTIERVERAEKVSSECLDRIAMAFGQRPGYYTAPRRRLTQEEAANNVIENFSHTEAVDVRWLRTQPQVREMCMCDGCLILRPSLGEEFDEAVSELWEWFDLASFIVGGDTAEGRRRELYESILESVRQLEKHSVTVLGGMMTMSQPEGPAWKIAVLSITSRSIDPGARKRRVVLVDRRWLPSNLFTPSTLVLARSA